MVIMVKCIGPKHWLAADIVRSAGPAFTGAAYMVIIYTVRQAAFIFLSIMQFGYTI